ncbi:hypothetical protein KGO95_03675 [Patescibacteria group bacterium]|nr:hypothetical protein [Patescibacteria group bacterium]
MVPEKQHKGLLPSYAALWAFGTTAIWLIACIFGEGLGGSLGANDKCYPYLGCTSGFFGYDAIEHFLFGVAAVFVLIWLFRSRFSLFSGVRWKDILILIALVALLSVFWELFECIHDLFRADILHQSLLDLRLHINQLDQPSNLDTMGDLSFALLGAFFASFFAVKE